MLKIGKNLSEEIQGAITEFSRQNLDVFAWAHSDMEGIDPSRKPVRQKRRAMDAERYQTLKEEVDKLLSCDFIKESFYAS